jgi:hypothetical protein
LSFRIGLPDRLHHLGVELIDDVLAHASRHHDAPPRAHVEAFDAASSTVGMSGNSENRFAEVTASARSGLAHVINYGRHRVEIQMDLARDQIDDRLAAAFIGNVQHVDFGLQLEQFAGQMLHGTRAGRRVLQLAWPRFGERDQFLYGLGGHRRVHDEQIGPDRRERDRGKVFLRVVRQLEMSDGKIVIAAMCAIMMV